MNNLTPALLDLMEHEKVIEQGLATFIDVGNALLAIRDGKKYRAAGYRTFEAYCTKRWNMSVRHARRMVSAAEVVAGMGPGGPISQPSTEAQARALAPLRKKPDQLADAWELALETADSDTPTAAETARARDAVVAGRDAVERLREGPAITKPALPTGVSHPARYSSELLPIFAALLYNRRLVLDPFAGTGQRLVELGKLLPSAELIGVEIEPEWANVTPAYVQIGNALALDFKDAAFDGIVTSPTYGNRLADHHKASDPHLRRSYTHDLGRQLHDNNSGDLHWGDEYRDFHERAWKEASRVLAPGGRFVLNIKDHIRDGRQQYVTSWHIRTLIDVGLNFNTAVAVGTESLGQGANAELRTIEHVIAFDKP